MLGLLLFLIFINDLADELTCNHLFFADDVKLIAPISQQHELRSTIRQAFNWSHRWDLPLNASKSHYLSIDGTPDLRIALSEEAAGKLLLKCEHINDLCITVNAAFTPSPNILADANVVLHKKIIYLSDKGDFRTSIQCFGATSSRIRHAS